MNYPVRFHAVASRAVRTPRGLGMLLSAAAIAVAGPSAATVHAAAANVAGLNQFGQLGIGTSGTTADPAANSVSTLTPVVSMERGVTAVAGGGAHSLAVKDGALYGWGLNTYGAVGNGVGDGNGGAPKSNNTPQPALVLTSGVTSVQAGLYHSMALANGAIYTFGLNTDGQLANGTAPGGFTSTPTIVPTMSSGVTAIASGSRHVLAIQNGGLYAWGYAVYGQIGNGQKATSPLSADQPPPVTTPTPVIGMNSGVTMVAAGGLHSLAVMNNAVYAFGSNQYGQLGNNGTTGTDTFDAFYATPQAVVGLPTGPVTDISAGNNFSLALVDGNVYAWGRNENGQLGQGNFTRSAVPLPVSGLGNLICDVQAGSTSSYALSADGSLWSWGGNTYGQLAIGATGLQETPQHVLPPSGYTYTGFGSGPTASHVLVLMSMVGDFNRDDLIDAADIDLLFAATPGTVTVASARYDVTGDGTVGTAPGAAGSDADYWVKTIKHTAYGDANLDGKVNFSDLLTLAQHYDAPAGGWASGNFDGLAGIKFGDLLLLAQNYGFGAASGVVAADFSADWALAQSLVPEPTSVMALAAATGVAVRRRRTVGARVASR